MRGITAWGIYLPYRRLDRSEIAPIAGKGGGKGTRTVAGFDEDPTTMAVEAGRRALAAGNVRPDTLLFGSVAPAYAEKTNATAVHAALRLDQSAGAFDLGSSARSAMSGLLMAACGRGSTMVTSGDVRVGLAGSADEAAGGDAGAAIVLGDGDDAPILAEIIGTASRTAEFVDRWRSPGDAWSKTWDDKFAEVTYGPLGKEAFDAATEGVDAVDSVVVSAPTARIAGSVAKRLGVEKVLDNLAANVGQCGAAQPGLLLAHLLESAQPGDTVALVSVTDGADAIVLRVTDAAAEWQGGPTVAEQAATGAPVSYGKFLAWRGLIAIDPPRRPEPQRVSATAAARTESWKFGFVGSEDPDTGEVHMPPRPGMNDRPMADVRGTIVTFTIDRVAYSPSPPIVFAVVDFDGGGRLPVELCDIDETDVEIGGRVEMTFRRLGTVDGIPNYFWKGRLARGESRNH